jgi:hypothetical protein
MSHSAVDRLTLARLDPTGHLLSLLQKTVRYRCTPPPHLLLLTPRIHTRRLKSVSADSLIRTKVKRGKKARIHPGIE